MLIPGSKGWEKDWLVSWSLRMAIWRCSTVWQDAKCVEEVKRINGAIEFEEAYRYQRRET